MPLAIKDFSPSSLAVINRWATRLENKIKAHEGTIRDLRTVLQQIKNNNPDLVLPKPVKTR